MNNKARIKFFRILMFSVSTLGLNIVGPKFDFSRKWIVITSWNWRFRTKGENFLDFHVSVTVKAVTAQYGTLPKRYAPSCAGSVPPRRCDTGTSEGMNSGFSIRRWTPNRNRRVVYAPLENLTTYFSIPSDFKYTIYYILTCKCFSYVVAIFNLSLRLMFSSGWFKFPKL